MNSQTFTCPNCQVKFKIKSNIKITKQAKLSCPKCKKILFIRPVLKEGDGTHQMETSPEISISPKAYDISIQNEIIEDFLRYYKPSEEFTTEPSALIADEPRAFREFLQKWLESFGFRTTVANDGREALINLQKKIPDVLFINVYQPIIMGITICEKIKNHPVFNKIKIILIGALWRTDRFRRPPEQLYSADAYIEETISKQELADKLKKILPKDLLGKLHVDIEVIKDSEIDYAKRLARIIFSDIEIYNSEKIKEAIAKGLNLEEVLKDDINEGRLFYRSKVSPSVLAKYNFYEEYLELFLKEKQRN